MSTLQVLDLVEDLRDAFIARRKSTSTRDTVPGESTALQGHTYRGYSANDVMGGGRESADSLLGRVSGFANGYYQE